MAQPEHTALLLKCYTKLKDFTTLEDQPWPASRLRMQESEYKNNSDKDKDTYTLKLREAIETKIGPKNNKSSHTNVYTYVNIYTSDYFRASGLAFSSLGAGTLAAGIESLGRVLLATFGAPGVSEDDPAFSV